MTADRSLGEQARDAAWFDADALIVTGSRLADPPLPDDLRRVREATALPVVAGSGVRSDNLAAILEYADAVIVGSALKEGDVWYGAMSKEAVLELARERDLFLREQGGRSCRRTRARSMMAPQLEIFYASDIHGSERVFRKFLNAAAFYKVQAIVFGGDLTGKAMIPFVETSPGILSG